MGTSRDEHAQSADSDGDHADGIGKTASLPVEYSDTSRDGRDNPPEDLAGPITRVETQTPKTLFQRPVDPPMLGRYVVLGTLGEGGMGTVLEAFDRTLDRKVAVKVLRKDLDDKHTARLLREARAMAKLSHPNVVPVFEVDTVGGQTFVVMERVRGQTLRRWMRQDPPPDWRQCVKVFIQAGQGLAAAHAEGLVHRDFKPSNAIIDDQGRARVLDFGLARRTEVDTIDNERLGQQEGQTNDEQPPGPPADPHSVRSEVRDRDGDEPSDEPSHDPPLTASGIVMGTPAYMPPEQMQEREVDARSDQFSFCVSLYEAVYGQRPFGGHTLTERIISMTDDGVRPAPKDRMVPVRLRTIVLRGLAVDPHQRWPSMEELLHQLRALVTPHTWRWMALGVTAGLAALGAGLALGQYVEIKERCTGAQALMDGLWDQERRQQVRAAFQGTQVSFAASTWARVEPQLDAYAREWIDTHTEICEATSVRGEQSEQTLDLRMRCLDRRRTALRATVDVLARADAEVMENAIELVTGLPTLARCDDLSWLEQQDRLVPPPEDPDVAAEVEALRARLADIEATARAGRYAEALDAIEGVVEQAEALGYPPLRAEALYRRGELREDDGQYSEAEQDLRRAHALAVEYRHDPVALDSAQALTFVVGVRLVRHIEGQQWGEMAAVPLAPRSSEATEQADSLNNLGLVFESQGAHQTARLYHQQALELLEESLGPDHPAMVQSLNNLGNVFEAQGDYQNAQLYHQRALAILEEALGPDHPHVARSLNNLGNVFERQGDLDNATLHFQRALRIWDEALGPDHPHVATTLDNLGNVFERQGDYRAARLHHQRALTAKEKSLGPDHRSVAYSLSNLGNVFELQGDYQAAQRHHQRALTILEEALGPDHPHVAASLNNLGLLRLRQGDHQAAQRHHQRALTILEESLGPDHPHVASALLNLGSVSKTQGDSQSAQHHYQRALAILEEALGPDHPHVASTLNNLGNVFLIQGKLDRARAHLQRALAIWDEALGPDHPKIAYPLVGLSTVALKAGDVASARAYAERAVSIGKAATAAPQLLAEARFVLARALWSTHGERARARALAKQAKEALAMAEGPGDSDSDVDQIEAWLATHRIQ